MHRFFVPPESIREDRVVLLGAVVHQIRDVLRMRPGDRVELCDDSGWAFSVELVSIERESARGRIVERWQPTTEPIVQITLYQGLLKGQKLDWVLQKGTELGIAAFVPVLTARCVVSSLEDVEGARFNRWERIITEAAEQSGRARLPKLSNAVLFRHACELARRGGLSVIPWEGERTQRLRTALQSRGECKQVSLFIGPEGGFAEDEVALAKGSGAVAVSLGPRILRAETAGLAAAAAVLYELGDLG